MIYKHRTKTIDVKCFTEVAVGILVGYLGQTWEKQKIAGSEISEIAYRVYSLFSGYNRFSSSSVVTSRYLRAFFRMFTNSDKFDSSRIPSSFLSYCVKFDR